MHDLGSLHGSLSCHRKDPEQTVHSHWPLNPYLYLFLFLHTQVPPWGDDYATSSHPYFLRGNKRSEVSALSFLLQLLLIRSLVTKSKYQAKRLLSVLIFSDLSAARHCWPLHVALSFLLLFWLSSLFAWFIFHFQWIITYILTWLWFSLLILK